MKKNQDNLLVIGLDGAGWDVIDYLSAQKALPNIDKLLSESVRKPLQSMFPPVTGSAWMTIATGKKPGRTGVFDFMVLKDRKNWQLTSAGSGDYRKNVAVWDHLDSLGKKTGIINYPVLFPAYPLNGIMIGGLGASEDGDIFYPPSLKYELNEKLDSHKIYVNYARPKYINPDKFIEDMESLIDYNYQLGQYLLSESYDLFIYVISATDFLCHYAWHWFEDRNHKYHRAFIELWTKIDGVVGRLIDMWQGRQVMLLSDHGMGRLDEVFLINQWLRKNKYLVLNSSETNMKQYLKITCRKGFEICSKILPGLSDTLFNNILRTKMKKHYSVQNKIDYASSRAFALDHSGLGHIYINTNMFHGDEYVNIQDEIISGLKDCCMDHGKKLDVYKKQDLYPEDNKDVLPDILFMIDENRTEAISSLYGRDIFTTPLTGNRTGSHRMEGIFALKSTMDMTGSLHSEMDLSHIYDIICKLTCSENPPGRTNVKNSDDMKTNPQEDMIVRKHLEDLGYL